jgi:hypothetical protein
VHEGLDAKNLVHGLRDDLDIQAIQQFIQFGPYRRGTAASRQHDRRLHDAGGGDHGILLIRQYLCEVISIGFALHDGDDGRRIDRDHAGRPFSS